MKTKKHLTLLILLCFSGIVQVYAQLSWARSFDINAAIPGATWTDISNVLKVDQNRYIVAGTVTGTGAQSCVVARFSQDGFPGWVREIKGAPGSAITVNDIAESKNAATPGYVICGEYEQGGITYNYLARIDDLGNLQWDHYWQTDARLVAVMFSGAANDIITTGEAVTTLGVRSIATYRFDNGGTTLASKIVDTDPQMLPVDILEDPTFNGTGGFFILANYKNNPAANNQAYLVFINYALNFVQSEIITYPPTFMYDVVEAVRFEQDINTRDLYILTNVYGSARTYRPSVIRHSLVAGGWNFSVVMAPPPMPNSEPLTGTDINLYDNDAKKGIMVTTIHQAGGSMNTYSWKMTDMLLTTNFNQQWLGVPNVRNMSLCLSADAQHYILAGHDAGNNLTLNTVDLWGDKVNNAGTNQCINNIHWHDENPAISYNPTNYSSKNIPVSPTSVSTSDPRSWSYSNACWCAEVRSQSYYRYAYPQVPYDNWQLDINRTTRSASSWNFHVANSFNSGIDKLFFIELNPSGQNINTYTNFGGNDKEARQLLESATNGDLIAAYRTSSPGPGGSPKTTISRIPPGGGTAWWTREFPGAQTPGRLFIAEALNASGDIIAVADIDGLDETSNTHDLMIARLTSGGTTIYYQEIPITFNGMQRDNFRVLALEPTRDGGFAICGSSGYQNADFIAGYVMKFSAAGTLVWQYEFRRQTPNPNNCYDLNGPQDCRSASMLFDLRHNGPNGYYVAGYTSDHDQNGQGASFWNGLVIHLNNSGVELGVQEYSDINGNFTTFKGIVVVPGDIAVVGDQTDPGFSMRNDLFVKIDKTTLGVVGAQTYSYDGNSSLLDIFNNGGGFSMAGSTTDWYGVRTPQLIGADYNGSNGCERGVDIDSYTPVNDPISLDLNPPVDHTQIDYNDEFGPTCVEVFDICQDLPVPFTGGKHTGLTDLVGKGNNAAEKDIQVYPNPASTLLNLDVSKDVSIRAVSIVDINGKEVYRSNASSMNNHMEINISELPEGMYAVKMETSAGKRYTRFIKL